jgi:DEAD/DEAH box helicase domain-containing protein
MNLLDHPRRHLSEILKELQHDRHFLQNVTAWETLPANPAQFADFPDDVKPKLKLALGQMGMEQLYTHQEEAYRRIQAGENVVVVTPTASGKTLCYNLPTIQTVLESPEARALYLFPTKALSQDQVVELQEIVNLLEADIKTYTFDGDTPADARRAIRSSGHIVVTNPDMLHQGILPHHTRWVKLFENLRFVVIDEIHHYRGVFGSHLANVIRRLKRICKFYNTDPQFICCSATIANPKELAEKIVEEPFHLIDKNGAPRGEKHFIFYNPPVVNQQLGIRRSVIKESARIARRFLLHSIQTILFARSRLRVEILVTYLKDMMSKHRKPAKNIRGYRGGYLPLERREIEQGLRDGSVLGVVSTNALELGIDIGQLDACVMAGYPGTVASTWQQAGRAGRRIDISAAIMVASSGPIDQYIVNHPEYFFGKPPESGIVNPNNLVILMSHVKCAAFELPFEEGEKFGIDATVEMLEYLEEHHVLQKQNGRYYWTSEVYPAEEVSLRSASPENFVIIDTTKPDHKVIGEIDLYAASLMVHDEAIYIHQSQQYHVDNLDWDRRKAYVHQVDVDYYTDAQEKTDIKVLDIFEKEAEAAGHKAHGEVTVNTTPTMFKKIKFNTHENVGFGKIELPELEMHTTSYMWQIDDTVEAGIRSRGLDFGEGMKGLGNVMGTVAPLFVMCDPKDIHAVPMLKSPFHQQATLYIYDGYPGGVGFSDKLFEIHDRLLAAARDLIQKCSCEAGCPSCVGPVLEVGEMGKRSTLAILEMGIGG